MAQIEAAARTAMDWLAGSGAPEAALAALVMYAVAMALVRAGKKRFLGRNTVFDFLLAFMLGSVLARAVNGDATIAETAVAGVVLILVHWIIGVLALHIKWFGRVVKGGHHPLIRDGVALEDAMADHHVTRQYIEEAARGEGLRGVDEVEAATSSAAAASA